MKNNNRSHLLPRMAFEGIRRNRETSLPYFIACVLAVVMLYTIVSLADNQTISQISGGENMLMILSFGTWVVAFFSVILLFYTNSFLIKRRKREFGLYTILGLEKKHVAMLLTLETLITGTVAIALGLVLGVILNKLLFLVLLKMIHFDIHMGFTLSTRGAAFTTLLFTAIFILNLIYNLIVIGRSRPVELLHSDATGEREPRTQKVLSIIGFVALAVGYAISLTVENPLDALYLFFIAVLLVIFGTYLLFTTGSIAILKALRRRKNYYYQTNHFISVSGMIYRMKQNAVGLANICILSTMVLVVLSTTLSLYVGADSILSYLFPSDMSLRHYDTAFYTGGQSVSDRIDAIVTGRGQQILDKKAWNELTFGTERTGDTFNFHPGNTDYVKASDLCMVDVMTLADYNAITGKNVALSGNQVLAHGNSFTPGDTLHLLGEDYTVTEKLSAFPLMETEYDKNYGLECLSLVVAHQNVMGNLAAKQASAYGDAASPLIYTISFNVTGSFNDKITCCKALNEPGALSASVDSTNPAIVTADQLATPGDNGQWDIRNRQNEYQTFYYAYGGILFLGILLGTVFLMAAVLIIYYKQVSEGYDDRSRFVIMQNVGMSQTEVKKAIRSQILTVFFLPLIVAACHVVFAFPVITKLLNLFSLFDTGLFIRCTLLVFATFAAVYAITFLLTARTYYKIIRK